MADYVSCTVFFKPQEGHTLPEGFREQFVNEKDEFTFAKTRPPEGVDERLDHEDVGDVMDDGTLTIQIDTAYGPPAPWLNHLAATYPNIIIECEFSDIDSFGRTVWANGGVVLDREQNRTSPERLEYFGYYIDEDDADTEFYEVFQDKAKEQAVQEVRSAVDSKNWVALMDALLTARHELDYFQNYDLDEDALRVAVVTRSAALRLMHAVLTDENVDSAPIAAQIGCAEGDEVAITAGEEPEAPATRETLLNLLETIAVQSALLLSLSSQNATESEIRRMKEKATQEASA
jgi:hypothetical protein